MKSRGLSGTQRRVLNELPHRADKALASRHWPINTLMSLRALGLADFVWAGENSPPGVDTREWYRTGLPKHPVDPKSLKGDDRILCSIVALAGRSVIRGSALVDYSGSRRDHVAYVTGLTKREAAQLCERFGYDPDDVVNK